MSALPESYYSLEDIAQRVSGILMERLEENGKEISQLLNVVFLTRDEVADFLRVKPNTIDKWLKDGAIPVRYANGNKQSEPRFLLAEILRWTLPNEDPHAGYRLLTVHASRLARGNQLAAVRKEN